MHFSVSLCILSLLLPSFFPCGRRSIMFLYHLGDKLIFSSSQPWRYPQKNKLSPQIVRGQVAYFRDLLIPQWQESVSDMPLAFISFGSGLVSVWSGERGKAWGEINVTQEWERRKKLFFFPSCFCCICVKMSSVGVFSDVFFFFWMLEVMYVLQFASYDFWKKCFLQANFFSAVF